MLAAAVVRWRWLPEAVVAVPAAGLLVGLGAVTGEHARAEVDQLWPVVGFLAAVLALADACAAEGLFAALGARAAAASGGRPRTLLGWVFAVAAVTTAVLSLDATVVLLTPVVLASATRARVPPRPHVYACGHLANTASLLLPVSNLTNLLLYNRTGLSFGRFTALMAAPWVVGIAVEYAVLRRFFAADLRSRVAAAVPPGGPVPAVPLVVVGLTLAGFGVLPALGVSPAWSAGSGAAVLIGHALRRGATTPRRVLASLHVPFLLFVLALGVVVRALVDHGLGSALHTLLPAGRSLPALLAVAAVAAVVSNLVNNLPAVLALAAPAAAVGGTGALLAVLVGVNVGPNLTYVGSLATLLWRRVLHSGGQSPRLGEFLRLGALSVPAVTVACVIALWGSLQVLG